MATRCTLVWMGVLLAASASLFAAALPPPPAPIPTVPYAPAQTSPAPAPVVAPVHAAPAATLPAAEADALLDYVKTLGITPTATLRDGSKGTLTFTANTVSLARFLAKLEGTNRPIRTGGMTIITPRSGVDDLRVELHVTLGVPRQGGIPLLACLSNLTALFPQEGNTIWATGFSVADDHQSWELVGRCTDAKYARDLLAAMQAAPQFQQPRLFAEPVDAATQQSAFRLTFGFKPEL